MKAEVEFHLLFNKYLLSTCSAIIIEHRKSRGRSRNMAFTLDGVAVNLRRQDVCVKQ